jgi:hypothetical protein
MPDADGREGFEAFCRAEFPVIWRMLVVMVAD